MTLIDYLLNATLIGLVALQIHGHRVTAVRLFVPVALTIWGLPSSCSPYPRPEAISLSRSPSCSRAAVSEGTPHWQRGSIVDGEGAIAKAGAAAALLWVVGIGARVGFYLWVTHGGQATVSSFNASVHVTSGARLAAGFILMAMAEVVSRRRAVPQTVHSGAVVPPRRAACRSVLA